MKQTYIPRASCIRCRAVIPSGGGLGTHAVACDPATKAARFWSKVEKRGDDECWGWNAQKRWDGYGRFVLKRKPMWAHRVSYELHHGPIPKGMHVLHSCDTPACTNPKHLRIGTHKENMEEMQRKGRQTNRYTPVDQLLHPEFSRRARANWRAKP